MWPLTLTNGDLNLQTEVNIERYLELM